MLMVRFYIKNIDYDTFVDKLMPFIEKWLLEKDNIFADAVKKLISKRGRPTTFSRTLISLLPNKNEFTAWLVPHFQEVLLEYLNTMLIDKGIIAKITELHIDHVIRKRSNQSVLKLEVTIASIDYEKTAENLAPMLMQKLAGTDTRTGRIVKMFSEKEGLSGNIAQAVIGAIPEAYRDELLAGILSEAKQEITEMANILIEENDLVARISNLSIKSI